jgi:hypothetical protein
MDHRYIDEHSVAGRYLARQLSAGQRAEFEAHVVDCQECTDRLLLAEMFENRNHSASEPPLRVRFVNLLTPWSVFLIMICSGMLLVLATASLLLWVSGLRGH